MKKINEWRPDTCGCTLFYEWETNDPPDQRSHKPLFAYICEHHKKTDDHRAVFNTVVKENTRKNLAVAALSEHNPDIPLQEIKFRFDKERKLILSHPKLIDAPRAAAHDALQRKFGDEVSVE